MSYFINSVYLPLTYLSKKAIEMNWRNEKQII